MTEPAPIPQLWELKITASGAVHDADGNLLSGEMPFESTAVVTEAQLQKMIDERTDS